MPIPTYIPYHPITIIISWWQDMLLARGEYQAALTELMVTFLLDMESYKRTVRFASVYTHMSVL